MLKQCLLLLIFLLFSYVAYSCEGIFDSQLKFRWLTGEELRKLVQDSQEFNRPGMFRVEYRPFIKQVEPLDRVPTEILNKRIIHYLDFSLFPAVVRGLIQRFLRDHIKVRNLMERQEMLKDSSQVSEESLTNENVIVYIGNLIGKSREELLTMEFIGSQTLYAFEYALRQKGLRLGMKVVSDWIPPSSRDIPVEVLNTRVVDYLDFSFVSTSNLKAIQRRLKWEHATRYDSVVYIGELIQLSERDLLENYYISQNVILVIEKALAEKDLYLSTTLPEKWERPTVED